MNGTFLGRRLLKPALCRYLMVERLLITIPCLVKSAARFTAEEYGGFCEAMVRRRSLSSSLSYIGRPAPLRWLIDSPSFIF